MTDIKDETSLDNSDIINDFNFDETNVGINDSDISDILDVEAPANNSTAPTISQDTVLEVPSGVVPSNNLPFLKWYDNTKNYKTYNIDKNFSSNTFNGSDECDTIHINVGFNTYGWLITFANGMIMSLPDVKEYQIRQGCLPFSDGRITYADSVLDFNHIKRIVIYESIKYFSYGA